MRLERHGGRDQAALPRHFHQALQQGPVAAMHAIEISDCQCAAAPIGQPGQPMENAHRSNRGRGRESLSTGPDYKMAGRNALIFLSFRAPVADRPRTMPRAMKAERSTGSKSTGSKSILCLISGRGSNLEALLLAARDQGWQADF